MDVNQRMDAATCLAQGPCPYQPLPAVNFRKQNDWKSAGILCKNYGLNEGPHKSINNQTYWVIVKYGKTWVKQTRWLDTSRRLQNLLTSPPRHGERPRCSDSSCTDHSRPATMLKQFSPKHRAQKHLSRNETNWIVVYKWSISMYIPC